MHRDYEREESRRRYRADDDPRDDPRERYGNEEDPYSREYRRVYAEEDLPRRLQDDRPYNRPGYEPEGGQPGGRENVDLQRGRGETRGRPYDEGQPRQVGTPGQRGQGERWQHGYFGQGQRFEGDPFDQRDDRGWEDRRSREEQSQIQRPWRAERYGEPSSGHRRPSSSYGQPAYGGSQSPYDQGDISSWYGGDTGMGEPGSSRLGAQSGYRPEGIGQGGRLSRGQFSGRGPRGYQRSDDRIREDACELLTEHGEIDASDMEVEVRDGTVILRGAADSGRTRRLAEELVEGIPGVHDVHNELRVNRQSAASRFGAGQGRYGAGDMRYGAEPIVDTGAFAQDGGGNRSQIRETMDVVGSDGESIGTVKAVHSGNFHLDRPMAKDLFVPFSAVRTVDGERVMLNVRASEVDDQRWPDPSLTGSNEGPAR